MTNGSPPHVWNRVAQGLHWIVAAMLLAQFILGWLTENAPDRQAEFIFGRSHFQLGMLLAGLILMRLLWRLSNTAPPPLPDEPAWRRRLATTVHSLIYLTLIVLLISGYIVWVHMREPMDLFGLVTVPTVFSPVPDNESLWAGAWYVHFFAGWTLVGLTILHVVAALYHQFVLRDGLVRRMLD